VSFKEKLNDNIAGLVAGLIENTDVFAEVCEDSLGVGKNCVQCTGVYFLIGV